MECFCASLDPYESLPRDAHPNAYKKVEDLIFDDQYQETGSSWVPLEIIFESLQIEPFRFKFNSLNFNTISRA